MFESLIFFPAGRPARPVNVKANRFHHFFDLDTAARLCIYQFIWFITLAFVALAESASPKAVRYVVGQLNVLLR